MIVNLLLILLDLFYVLPMATLKIKSLAKSIRAINTPHEKYPIFDIEEAGLETRLIRKPIFPRHAATRTP